MKKILFIIQFSVLIYSIAADDFADILQDLAVQTACLGIYTETRTSIYATLSYDDPFDWYDSPILANRFARISGINSRINTFYGLCFDYAKFAWDIIKRYQKMYNKAGMKGQQWYIAIAYDGNPYTIILYKPVFIGKATHIYADGYVWTWREEVTIIDYIRDLVFRKKDTTIPNRFYIIKENSRHNVYTHDGVSGHAWLWVQHNDGTWYWIDPTYTDNTGYVWWGIVEDGREAQRYPDPDYCIASDYPRPDGIDTGKSISTLNTSGQKPANSRLISISIIILVVYHLGLLLQIAWYFENH
jgi:hypothetical protein